MGFLKDAFEKLDVDPVAASVVPMPDERRAGFLAIRSRRAGEMVRKLRERNVKFEELVFPDDVHDFLRHENWLRAYAASVDFFDRHLK